MNTDTFIPTFGNRPLRIVGREKIIDDFTVGLESSIGHPNRASVLIGQRGTGKTALLLEFAEIGSARDFIPVRVLAGSDMLNDIIETIQAVGQKYIAKAKKPVKALNASAFGFSFGLTFTEETEEKYGFRTKLTLLADVLAGYGKGLLFLIDEIQAMSDEMRVFASTYQHIVGDRKNVAVVMAGLPHAISSVLNDRVLTFLHRARKIELQPIALSEIRSFYTECFDQLGLTISRGNLETAVAATCGYPYLLQLIGYYILKYAGAAGKITGNIVRMAINSSEDDLIDSLHRPCLSPLSKRDIAFLEAMAEDDGETAISDIVVRLGVSQGTVQTYRKRLVEAGVIAATRRGYVDMVVPYMREYLNGTLRTSG
ncbi:MAG: winged helix-turn-helix transcriptional regulator [Clostridiales Family XIII bacterium]|jgi:DNA-binding NarL/FixJ family response regulator|nr:winged helix-turn-helix transcriptional regulator [Clostridiales Family XIII bacterium]